ncbi:helix-turn-helix domain-containing protein [Ancrocorticia populi]|uniref:helix-turn-helix domain-containing protein n=1 Tax=Ancrocorticia populi TaxID=2175228 RepID=UPI003F995ADF
MCSNTYRKGFSVDADSNERHEEWLTSGQVAELLPQVTRRSIQTWAKKGMFPGAVQLPSGQWRFPKSGVEKLMDHLGM